MDRAPRRASIVTRGRNWARGVLISGVVVAVAALVVLWLLVPRHGGTPDQVARDFLTSTSCSQLYDLATDAGDKLLGGGGCDAMIRAAKGQRTYADQAPRRLTRRLSFGEPIVTGRSARVQVRITYPDADPPVPPETLVLVIVKVGNDWLVDDWGLPAA